MRVWIDMTASAHVLVFRPLIEIMRKRGRMPAARMKTSPVDADGQMHGLAPLSRRQDEIETGDLL